MNETLDIAMFFGLLWGSHAIPIAVVSVPVWFFGRHRVEWWWADFAVGVLPFALWATLMLHDGTGKSLANVVEGVWLGCVIPVSALVRLAVGRKGNRKMISAALLAALCLAAVGLWLFVPALPE